MPEGQKVSRRDTMDDPLSPPVEYGLHLVQYLRRIADKTSYCEIESWSNLTKTPLRAWEAETMVLLGSKYYSMLEKAKKPDAMQPFMSSGQFDDDSLERIRAQEAGWFDQMTSMMSAAGPNGD